MNRPIPGDKSQTGSVSGDLECVIPARRRDVGNVTVRRLIPSRLRRTVGPFIFLDHMGPHPLPAGEGVDVPPHPHIDLATVTYLFEGELVHRDSLGSVQVIRPGDINWMHAGSGIVHSERTPSVLREQESRIEGLQLWVALPKAAEQTLPRFDHYPVARLPGWDREGIRARILAGSAYGATSPVATASNTLYVDVLLEPGTVLTVPRAEERSAYVARGSVFCGRDRLEESELGVFVPGSDPVIRAETAARILFLGGDPLDGERHVWWNFVSSSPERIEQARRDWHEGRFPRVPGDEEEFAPLPRG
jgi:redox-sensitive bicupin YhaK (pirin superfamily)